MAQRILKNNTASPVVLPDTGQTVPASGQLVINPYDYGKYEGSSDVLQYLTDQAISATVSTLTANDGTFDLGINEGVRLIQGGFSRPISDGDDPTIKAKVRDGLGNVEHNRRILSESVLAGYDSAAFRRVETTIRTDSKIGLVVDAILNPAGAGTVPSVSSKLKYLDMNAANGGIARESSVSDTFTRVFRFTGAGLYLGAVINIENKDKWFIRLVIDGDEVLGANGLFTKDLIEDKAYDLDDGGSTLSTSEGRLGISMEAHDRFVWTPTSGFPVRFNSSVEWWIKRSDTSSKKFYAGLAILEGS